MMRIQPKSLGLEARVPSPPHPHPRGACPLGPLQGAEQRRPDMGDAYSLLSNGGSGQLGKEPHSTGSATPPSP